MLLPYKPYWFGPSTPSTDSFAELAPDSTGKKVQMFENTIAGNLVEAMAITQVSDLTGWLNSFVEIAPDSTGKKFQYFENVVGSETVDTIAVVLVDTSGKSING